jgi:hypothetical protein
MIHLTLREGADPVESSLGWLDQTLRFDHLERMLTDIGLWQHTAGDLPNERHGYSIDDEARGLIVALRYWQSGVFPDFSRRLGATCFQFLQSAALSTGDCTGRYHNFCDAQGRWLDSIGSDDSFGRTLWGLGVACAVDAPFAPRRQAEALLRCSLPAIQDLKYPRAKAFVILGLGASRVDDVILRRLADELADAYEAISQPDWHWFEGHFTYCNARLPQAMFIAASIFPDDTRFQRIGTESLDFLLKISRCEKGGYAPIGNAPMEHDGWFKRGQKKPPLFDQQPVDTGALVESCVEAYHVTREPRFRQAANAAFGWYFGDNCHGLPVYNPVTGAVADALTRGGLNRNQGAESVLSIHLAHQALQTLE